MALLPFLPLFALHDARRCLLAELVEDIGAGVMRPGFEGVGVGGETPKGVVGLIVAEIFGVTDEVTGGSAEVTGVPDGATGGSAEVVREVSVAGESGDSGESVVVVVDGGPVV